MQNVSRWALGAFGSGSFHWAILQSGLDLNCQFAVIFGLRVPSLDSVIAAFGQAAKQKLKNPSVSGQPEDQLRAPFEQLLLDLAKLADVTGVTAIGESSLSDLQTRPDYAITVENALVGFVELKAPGKGGDPRKFKDKHDRAQWEKLQPLPNLIYTDGNVFSLWQNGELTGDVIRLDGDIETAGTALKAPQGLLTLFESFLNWRPIAPASAKALAETTARLCRLLREEVTEQLEKKAEVLTGLADDWRRWLFPDATDERFADGYAQAVAFGMLMARARGIKLSTGLPQVAQELSKTATLIGAALKLLTDDASNQATLKTSLGTLVRVLDAVDWNKISKDFPEAWLYFYEDFLEVYDNELRKKTGSYYTPPEVVGAMVSLTDEALRIRFGLHAGLASPSVTLADPAVGTGTFLLGVLRKIAQTVEADEGKGAVKAAVNAAVKRLIAFEMQLGPFAVAQLRILAEIVALTGSNPTTPMRMFVTDTLGNPHDDEGYFPQIVAAIARSRKEANKIKREEPITVVIGNPPYKVKAKGLGGWVEGQTKTAERNAPLAAWMPPAEWNAGTHSKHLRNLYVYFWRWATWKVYDHGPGPKNGVVSFITVAGFLNGLGFQKMRDYLRRTCEDLWVIDCSPEGFQPDVPTRIFEDVQQPVCIVIASRNGKTDQNTPAAVHFRQLSPGHRKEKFVELTEIQLMDGGWTACPTEWRAPFLPASAGAWSTFPRLQDLFVYDGSGVMPGRVWIVAPDIESLEKRWHTLITAPISKKEELFHPHLQKGTLGDRHVNKTVKEGLPGFPPNGKPIATETAAVTAPVRYGFRTFDRQWIIPDNRVINRPNPELWRIRSDKQVYLTAFTEESPKNGPALTFTALIPDLHHYKGSFGGRTYPLWSDPGVPNLPPKLLLCLSEKLEATITAEDLMAYIAAVAAHPGYTVRFKDDLSTPGLRIPITADDTLFSRAIALGRDVIWFYTFGERYIDASAGRPAQPPRVPIAHRPVIPEGGEIPQGTMPNEISYDTVKKRLHIGAGFIENVEPEVWAYQIDNKQVLLQWFSYRKADRERPIIGDRRSPSPLGNIQPSTWLPEYTTELLNVLNVLTFLVALEPKQMQLLEEICAGPLVSDAELEAAGAFEVLPTGKKVTTPTSLF